MLSENLRKFREQRGYSRPHLARLTEINTRTIEYIEWGKNNNPNIRTLEKLAAALDVTVDDLLKK